MIIYYIWISDCLWHVLELVGFGYFFNKIRQTEEMTKKHKKSRTHKNRQNHYHHHHYHHHQQRTLQHYNKHYNKKYTIWPTFYNLFHSEKLNICSPSSDFSLFLFFGVGGWGCSFFCRNCSEYLFSLPHSQDIASSFLPTTAEDDDNNYDS